MSVVISEEIKQALADPASVKILASVSKEGIPHAVAKGSLTVNEKGQIVYFELLERQRTMGMRSGPARLTAEAGTAVLPRLGSTQDSPTSIFTQNPVWQPDF